MARVNRSREKGKQFTAREKVLLGLLVVAAMIYAYFNFFLLPTQAKIAVLETEKSTLEGEYKTRNTLISQKKTLAGKLEENSREVNGYKDQYFKTANQEHLIKVLETELLDDDNLKVPSLSFTGSQPASEFVSTEGASVLMESSVISFPFEGSYENLISLTNKLEQYKNMIRINAMDITYMDPSTRNNEEEDLRGIEEAQLYQGNITVEFFTIPQEYEYPWDSSLPSYDMADNYNGNLFTYEDGGEGIPPFLIVKENPDVVGGEEPGTIPGNTIPGNTIPGNTIPGNTIPGNTIPGNTIPGNTIPGNTKDPDDSGSGSTVPDDNEEPDDSGSGSTVPDDNEEPDDPDLTYDGEPNSYVVLKGDTIYSISHKIYQSSEYIELIMAINNITDPTKLKIGTELMLPNFGK